ncbi:protein neprosin-like isoform X2 [Euphorbia lathyris]|uniref:protein neprosin-like isoform X2 n=1 Tax=Euphorbia lathyris TaxID=212925 RepID=UPI0033140D7B
MSYSSMLTLSSNFVDGRMMSNHTIESSDGSYVVECVDIYKQPAFSHPLLKNHTMQKRPTSSPIAFKERSKDEIFQRWKKNGKCPIGTIPIATSQFFQNRTHPSQIVGSAHEYVTVTENGGPYYGATASLNIWSPSTSNVIGEYSSSQIWVVAGKGRDYNTIEAGWKVDSGVNKPQFFIFWTGDNYDNTGCYNLNCPGFVQTNRKIAIGADLSPVSTYNANQIQIQLTIHKDQSSGNWWLRYGQEEIGYWPGSILTSLAKRSSQISWGGVAINSRINGKHTSTQMGSGHFSSEGYGKASYVGNLGYIDNSGATIAPNPQSLVRLVTNPACYDFSFGKGGTQLGLHFYFGGPGFSPRCQ